jgi:hypothetical protein
MTDAKLRRAILHALHQLTGSYEPWRELGQTMARVLGPWVGMSATERWETMPRFELELLLDVLEERAAATGADCSCRAPALEGEPADAPASSCSVHHREVIVCGGRDYQPTREDGAWLTWWLAFLAARTVVHGAARGVDTWAGTLASRLGLLVASVPADWDGQGVAAGPIRNRLMIDRGPVGVIALPGGKGTYDMVKAATARNVPVFLRDDPQLAAWREAG